MAFATVVIPLALAAGTLTGDDQWPWVRYVIPPAAILTALVGVVYSLRHWSRPPHWAMQLFARGGYERD